MSDLAPLARLVNLQSLNCSDTLVSDLAPLARLVNLHTLSCSNTQLSDLAPLVRLVNLHTLSCSNTQVSDLAPLARLVNLHTLSCSNTQVSDLAPLVRLVNLYSLDCSSPQVSDLAPLVRLVNLHTLSCSDTQVSDLAPLARLVNLHTLSCSDTLVSDLAPLARLVNLQALDCSHTQVGDLAPLARLVNLQALDCSSTQVSDLAPLARLVSMQSLDCEYTQVSDLAPLAELVNLQSLSCVRTPVSNLASLAPLVNLKSLNCQRTQVRDLAPLARLVNLKSLKCSGTQVGDLAPLAGLVNLQSLDCPFTQVGDLAPLAGLVNLQSLNCWGTQVGDLAPLAGLVNLQSLDCSATQVGDLAPLARLVNLHTLHCYGTPVSDLAPLVRLVNLHELACSDTQVSDLAPLARLVNLHTLACSNTQVSDLAPLVGLVKLRNLGCFDTNVRTNPEALIVLPQLSSLRLRTRGLTEIPLELQSRHSDDNCLFRLRSHFLDLGKGSERLPDVKVLVLGNGRIGKTQICRRLVGEEYDERVGSTHGIVITSTVLPINEGRGESASEALLHLWDFGGQDLYHGTHALFLSTQSIFMIVWTTSSENEETHEYEGITFRNHRLPYWVETVRHLIGTNQPLILAQNQCDRAEDEALRPPIDDAILMTFPSRKPVHYSAKLNRGRGALDDALKQAIERQWELRGRALLSQGWLKVRRRLESMQQEDHCREVAEKRDRTITRDEFDAICREAGGVSSSDVLLEYLNAAGVVIHHRGLFGGRIILDHAWALEPVYAVFDRKVCYQTLRDARGRFTRPLLQELVWRSHSVPEQELFLELMTSCGVCFRHREGDELRGRPAEYIAPDLLPQEDEVELELESMWSRRESGNSLTVRLPFLPPGLMRGLISKLGQQAGLSAIYWKNGLCFYERTTRSYARIDQHLDPSPDHWGGHLNVETRGGQSGDLLSRIRAWLVNVLQREAGKGWTIDDSSGKRLTEKHVRATPAFVASAELQIEGRLVYSSADGTEGPAQPPLLAPGTPPLDPQTYGISYAREDPSQEIVERICQSAYARGKTVLRDTTGLARETAFSDLSSSLARAIGGCL